MQAINGGASCGCPGLIMRLTRIDRIAVSPGEPRPDGVRGVKGRSRAIPDQADIVRRGWTVGVDEARADRSWLAIDPRLAAA
jgi:hypothetical protein